MKNIKRKIGYSCVVSMLAFTGVICIQQEAQANFMDVLNTVNSVSNTINSVNRAGRGTMSTVEYAQRFQDRQQDRQDRKRVEKSYNASAEEEYYRTLQETQMLKQQYYNSNL